MASIRKRTLKGGEARYDVRIRVQGGPTQSATFTHMRDARRWIADTEGDLRKGRRPPTKQTLAEAVDAYQELGTSELRPKTISELNRRLHWWSDQLGKRKLAELDHSHIARALHKLDVGPATKNRYHSAVSAALEFAIRELGWLDQNPARKVRRKTEPHGRVRWLEDDERDRLLANCKQSKSRSLYPLVVLAMSTGARQGELTSLTWSDVDLSNAKVFLSETKNTDRRTLYLPTKAVETLRDWRRVRFLATNEVFPNGFPRTAWEKAVERAKVKNFRFHDLRHHFASQLAMQGATLPELAAALGHRTFAMVKRYAHLSPGHLEDAIRRMSANLI